MKDGLKSKVMSGMIWRFAERICAQMVTFIVSIILARLLEPEHYGVVSITMIFITFANVFVSDGFGKGLVQKHDADDLDFSSVFYANIAFSIVIYAIIFLAAPLVSDFYGEPLLTWTLRILGLRIILASVNVIQQAYVQKNMMFKLFFKATLLGTIVSAVVGISMAFMGFGVWALVGQYLTNTLIDTIVLWFTVKWRPIKKFSLERVNRISGVSISLLSSALINSLYDNLRSLFIGKRYSSSDLAYYTKGVQYPNLIITNVNTTIGSVLYPSFAKLQGSKDRLKNALRKSIKYSTYIIFPTLFGLFAVAPEAIELMLTEKWLPCVPYLRIACIYLSLWPINTANLQAVIALGESKHYFKLTVMKKAAGLIILLISIPFGITWIAASEIVAALFAVFSNVSINKELLGYSFKELFEDVSTNAIMGIVMCIVVAGAGYLLPFESLLIKLAIEIIIGVVVYIGMSVLRKSEEFLFFKEQALSMLHKANTK